MKLNMSVDVFTGSVVVNPVCLRKAAETVKNDGYILLEEVVSFDSLDVLLKQMTRYTSVASWYAE